MRLDAEELRRLASTAERQRVKDILVIELRKLETEISLKQDALKSTETTQPAGQMEKSSAPRISTVDIKNYGTMSCK